MTRYDDAVSSMRVELPAEPGLRDYVRFGTLASNSHNTQPWKFRLAPDTIDIFPDFSRRTPIVDPDDHHLFVSLGCAAENVVIAANATGRPAELSVATDGRDETAISIVLAEDRGAVHTTDADLCSAIPRRQSTKSEYDGQALSEFEIRRLEEAATIPGVDVHVVTERPRLEQALELIQMGRSFERFALRATVLGIRHAHLNMPIEVPEIRPALADWLGIPGRRPDLVIRFGRARPMPMSIRRPLEAVIVP